MNALKIFNHATFGNVRAVDRGGQPWFVAKDVCDCLDIRTNDAANSLDEDEKGYESIVSLGGAQQTLIISEPGLYSLILRSRKPDAKAFKRWLVHEVPRPEAGSAGPTAGRRCRSPCLQELDG
ncbi:MAG: Bro-N domain-containing protein [Desulfovibrio sp.]|uniref:BRO-N domain-containing protein n=1 Tax=Desulfovibrio sp. TaxID=885 RepID=UPI00135E3E47|nr:Bro-N domain-containing protein [Desulfovibrio sp.]MTJ92876.1 Bro-N domain-containing protein [Desulfovibrio sp.]